MKLWKLCLYAFGVLLFARPAKAQDETPAVLVCEADELRSANAYRAAFYAYERAFPYYEADSNYYMMAYLKTWASEMSYEGGVAYLAGDAAVQKAYRIAKQHLNTDTLSYYPVTLLNMGIYTGYIMEYEKKLAFYHEAKEAARRIYGQNNTYTAIAYNNLGYAYGDRSNYKKSLAYTDTALQIAKRIEDPSLIFAAQNNRAHVYAEMGDFERALNTQEIALKSAIEEKDRARALNNLGVFYVEIKEWEKGIVFLKKALSLRRKISDTFTDNIFSTQLNLVWAFSESGQTAQSNKLLEEVIREATERSPHFDESPNLRIAYNYRAKNALDARELGNAIQFVQLAEGVASGSKLAATSTKLVKSMVLRAQGNLEEALWALQESYKIMVPSYKPGGISDFPDWRGIEAIAFTLTLFKLHGELLEERAVSKDDPLLGQSAMEVLQAADSAVTVSRLSYQSQLSKDLMAANAKSLYNALIKMHYRLYQQSGNPALAEQAFKYMEKSKALSVLENLNTMEAARFHDIPGMLVESERDIRQDIAFYQLELKTNVPEGQPELKARWNAELARLMTAQDSLLRIIKARYPRYYKTRINIEMPDLKTVQDKVIGAEETMIEYFQADDDLYVLIATETKKHFIRLQVEGLVSMVRALHNALRNKDNRVGEVSYQLYQQVFEPLLEYINNDKILLIPDGVLSYVPFDQFPLTAPESGEVKYLMEAYQTRRLLSGSIALLYKGGQQSGMEQVGITAMAPLFTSGEQSVQASEKFGPLPGAQKEVKVLDQLFPGTYLTGGEATEEAFKARCGESGMIHLATHTHIDDQFPGATHLLLKETDQEDGRLNIYEIYGQSIPAQLGFLSGCNTGFGHIKAGEGAVSLGHAFAYAGCPNIVMTLWPVKDDLAPELVQVFYEGIAAGLDKASALRQAKLFCLKNDELFAHPYYWSGFVYSGDLLPVHLNKFALADYPGVMAGMIFLIVLAAGLGWYRFRKN